MSEADIHPDSASGQFEIVNARGLHARAAAKFCKMAGEFEASITISKDNMQVCASSILGVLMLEAHKGTHVFLLAQGPDAEKAISTLGGFVASGFDEDD